jgi:hypothetical protein
MAKQAGPFFFTGTIGDVIFYKLGDQYLMRMKGDYNKKRMQKPGAYPLMQLRQQEFGQASKLASQVRRQLPLSRRKEVTIGSLTKKARQLLREGKTHEEIKAILLQAILPAAPSPKQQEQNPEPPKPATVPPAPAQVKAPKRAKHSNWHVSDKGQLDKQPRKGPNVDLKNTDNANRLEQHPYGWPYSFDAALLLSRQWLN